MIPLEQIKVASPCHADWDEMTGTGQVRFCQGCRKNVYNLSEMIRAEAEALVEEKEGRLCVRFYTRADGTMLTQDCPVGLRAVRYRRAKKFSYAAALLLSCGTGLLRGNGTAQAVTTVKSSACAVKPPVKPHTALPASRPTMGKPVMPRKKTPPPVPPMQHTMGIVAVPMPPVRMGEPTMGAPLPVPPKKGK